NNFYKEKQYGFDMPLKYIHLSVDGTVSYNAILYIPENMPYDFYSKDYEKGLELYSNGVMIMNKCSDLLPDYFGFVKGIVDSEDLSLNISREILQHDRQLRFIAKNIKNKIKNELEKMLKNERENYEKFYKSFGRTLKFGVYDNFGSEKEVLQDLLMFYSSKEKKMVTLDEYITRMTQDQKYIYYAVGESIDKIEKMPQTEILLDKGYEILYFTDDIDEFAIKMLMKYKEKEFKSVSSSDLGINTNDEETEAETANEENKKLFDAMKDILNNKVSSVKISNKLKNHPVCLSNEGDLSIEMEKVLNSMPNNQDVKAKKVLEINIHHNVFNSLKDAYYNDKDKLNLYTNLLYNQAVLIEGLSVSDPVEFTNDICKLMK
ncbi:molecular chaperone HtpG, partial [uncultured Clostridium sp.]|uniref:molecular chaperone HtpG n=1 Tax=uncultured Clostridium sp. TaxID=59620 RepID=UPI00272E558F